LIRDQEKPVRDAPFERFASLRGNILTTDFYIFGSPKHWLKKR